MHSVRKIRHLFAMEWSNLIQYRADVFLWMSVEAIFPLITLAIWYTVAKSSGRIAPIDVFTYYIIVIFVRILTDAWNGLIMAQDILDGKIVKYLVRPVSVFWKYIANDLMEKAFKLVLPLPVFILILVALPQYFSPAIYQWGHIALFAVSLALAMVINFLADSVIGFAAFWLEDPRHLRGYKWMLESVTSGILIPLAFLPVAVQSLFSFLPFRYVISAPIEILMGQAEGPTAIWLLITQLSWIALLFIISFVMWRKGLQRYAVPGQ